MTNCIDATQDTTYKKVMFWWIKLQGYYGVNENSEKQNIYLYATLHQIYLVSNAHTSMLHLVTWFPSGNPDWCSFGIAVNYDNLNWSTSLRLAFVPLIMLQTEFYWFHMKWNVRGRLPDNRVYQISIYFSEYSILSKNIIAKTTTTNWV